MNSGYSKSQLDRLGKRLRAGKINEEDIRLLDAYRRSFSPAYNQVVTTIRETLGFEPTGRPAKSTGSIVEKLGRQTIRLAQIQDIAGCRVVVSGIDEQNGAASALANIFPDNSIFDRRDAPSHGYRAVHVVPSLDGMPIEVQVRTRLQHQWAELSEKLADLFDPSIKYGGGEDEVVGLLMDSSEIISQVEARELGALTINESDPTFEEFESETAEMKRRLGEALEQSMFRLGNIGRT